MVKKYIYADNAATSKLSEAALDAMLPFYKDIYANPSQLYSFSREAKKAVNVSREIIAECIGAKTEEIIFTSGGTESDNFVIKNAIFQNWDVVTSMIEHNAILKPCEQVKSLGGSVHFLNVDKNGIVDVSNILNKIQNMHGIMSIMMVNNEIGTLQPIESLIKFAHDNNLIFHTDAVQAVGHTHIDVKTLDIDLLSASAHKFNGPKGVGFLYKKRSVSLYPLLNGGGQELGNRAGTENVPAVVGMAIALKENVDNLLNTQIKLKKIECILLDSLLKKGVNFIRNGINHLPGFLSLSFPGFSGEQILHRLDLKKIIVSTGSACDSNNTQISHVLKDIGLDDDVAKGTIRITLGRENSEQDAIEIANSISSILKNMSIEKYNNRS